MKINFIFAFPNQTSHNMEDQLSNALLLLVIGMSAVYLVLFIVVNGGRLLIRLVNTVVVENNETPFTSLRNEVITEKHEATIKAAVSLLTRGRGTVTRIEKK
jgi:Na+-transporting methylmalonyl-CoA/oxaloacetate decarboxylase gamma subunit